MAKHMVCPNGCNTNFIVTAHVTQDWKVNSEGFFVESINDCVEVTHKPNEDDVWVCDTCGAEGKFTEVISKSKKLKTKVKSKSKAKAKTKQKFYNITFSLTLNPGFKIYEILKSLSTTIAEEVFQEFPEIAFVSSCEAIKEKKG